MLHSLLCTSIKNYFLVEKENSNQSDLCYSGETVAKFHFSCVGQQQVHTQSVLPSEWGLSVEKNRTRQPTQRIWGGSVYTRA